MPPPQVRQVTVREGVRSPFRIRPEEIDRSGLLGFDGPWLVRAEGYGWRGLVIDRDRQPTLRMELRPSASLSITMLDLPREPPAVIRLRPPHTDTRLWDHDVRLELRADPARPAIRRSPRFLMPWVDTRQVLRETRRSWRASRWCQPTTSGLSATVWAESSRTSGMVLAWAPDSRLQTPDCGGAAAGTSPRELKLDAAPPRWGTGQADVSIHPSVWVFFAASSAFACGWAVWVVPRERQGGATASS
jgi:hypothetical protein